MNNFLLTKMYSKMVSVWADDGNTETTQPLNWKRMAEEEAPSYYGDMVEMG